MPRKITNNIGLLAYTKCQDFSNPGKRCFVIWWPFITPYHGNFKGKISMKFRNPSLGLQFFLSLFNSQPIALSQSYTKYLFSWQTTLKLSKRQFLDIDTKLQTLDYCLQPIWFFSNIMSFFSFSYSCTTSFRSPC